MKKTPHQIYYDWWVGKWCRNAASPYESFELVLDVELIGPPSFVYGDVVLILSGGKRRNVIINAERSYHGAEKFRPRKMDVIALTMDEYHEEIKRQIHEKQK